MPVVRSLVAQAVGTLEEAPTDAALPMRVASRALCALKTASKTKLGAPVLSTSDRVLSIADSVLDAGITRLVHSRAYANKMAARTVAVAVAAADATVVKYQATASAAADTRAKTRAGIVRVHARAMRIPADVTASVKGFYIAKAHRASMLVASASKQLGASSSCALPLLRVGAGRWVVSTHGHIAGRSLARAAAAASAQPANTTWRRSGFRVRSSSRVFLTPYSAW